MTLILTLKLDDEAQEHFEKLRQLHFPPERNQIPAHFTLFHHLPMEEWVMNEVEKTCGAQDSFSVRVTGLRSLGRGVAYTLASPQLMVLHGKLSEAFAEELTAQDRQRFMPHIVVQNKTTSDKARELLAQLRADFTPRTVQAQGVDVWEYLGGPWRHLQTCAFAAEGST